VDEVETSPATVAPRNRRSGRRLRLPGPLVGAVLVAAVLFTLGSIGSPLLGLSVFAGTDELGTRSPYLDAGLAPDRVQNRYVDDTYTSELPNTLLYVQSVRDGNPASWNPYTSGGIPLGDTPNYALYNPLTLPYYVLPGWLAPAYGKLLEICCAILGTFLFLRRLRLGRAAAVLGGTVFASTAFMIVWTNWPQTRVAAFIPWVFWAVERLVQRRRPTDAVLLALPIAFMILGGFPAVTAFALCTAVPYALVRALAEHGRTPRRVLGLAGLGVGAAVAAVALAAVQILPFTTFYQHWLIEGRAQGPADHLSLAELATSFAPWAFGGLATDSPSAPFWYLSQNNLVEAMSYVGAAAAVLAIVAVALAGPARCLLPRGAWWLLVAASGGWLALIYLGGPLRMVRFLPVFSSNFVGRARSVLGLLVAVLAAVGFELLLHHGWRRLRSRPPVTIDGRRAHSQQMVPPDAGLEVAPQRSAHGRLAGRRLNWRSGYAAAVWLAAGTALLVVLQRARHAAGTQSTVGAAAQLRQVGHTTHELLIGLAFVAVALLAAAVLYWAPQRSSGGWPIARIGAAMLLPGLIAVQALTLTTTYYPRVPRSTFYPTTDVQKFLAANLGTERFAATLGVDDSHSAMIMGVDAVHHLRALSGHGFINENFATLVRGVPGNPIFYPTYIEFKPTADVIASPILDVLSTKYFVTSPRNTVFGTERTATGDGTTAVLAAGASITVPVPGRGPLRAVGFTPTSAGGAEAYPDSWVEVAVRDATGATVATARRLTEDMVAGQPFLVPVAADQVPANTRLSTEFTLHTRNSVTVQAKKGAPAVSTVAGADDGIRLAYSGSAVVYERLAVLPRVRWASSTIVQPDQQARVRLLASGAVSPDQVVLDSAGPAADGRPATVRVDKDGMDEVSTTVTAQGAGYLVVADADQIGWAASVDGRSAPLVAADQGVVAVPVPVGTHTVTLHYASPHNGAGTWISVIAVAVMIAMAAADRWVLPRIRHPRAEI
jgi:hypothetical protein